MDEYILNVYNEFRQKQNDIERKNRAVNLLTEIVARHINGSLHVIGSSATGLADADSDLDIMFRLHNRSFNMTKRQIIRILSNIKMLLRASGQCSHVLLFHRARCPILRFQHHKTRVLCDLSLHSPVSLYNTALMTAYCQHHRVLPFVMFAKHWAKKSDIADPTKSTLSSYAVELMAINYLQSATEPRLLPSLQEELPKVFSSENLLKHYNRISIKKYSSMFANGSNTQSVGDIFTGFVNHYAEMDFENRIMSVRMGKLLQLQPKLDGVTERSVLNADFGHKVTFPETGLLNVEEPYSRQNVSRTVTRGEASTKISNAFRAAASVLNKSKILRL